LSVELSDALGAADVRAIKVRYSSGTTNRVRTVEKARPQTMAVATGPQTNDLPPSPVAREKSPAMVVMEVIRMGMTRRRAA
jgi:hypothetical protein